MSGPTAVLAALAALAVVAVLIGVLELRVRRANTRWKKRAMTSTPDEVNEVET